MKPYDFEPEISYAEEEQTPESVQSILTSRIGNIHWCLCGECKPMETEAESLCCLDLFGFNSGMWNKKTLFNSRLHSSWSIACLTTVRQAR